MITNILLFVRKITSYLLALLKLFQATLQLMAQRYRSASLRFKIVFLVVILLTSTSLVLCIMTVQIMNNYILNEIIKRGESVGKSIAASAGYSLLSRDLLGLDNLVFKAKSSNSDMPYVAIVDPNMKTVVHSETPMIGETMPVVQGLLHRRADDGTTVKEMPNPSGNIFEISCPIVFMKKTLGYVIIGMNKSILVEAHKKKSKTGYR